MKLITLDIALSSVLLVIKLIGRVKKGVYYISLISHFNGDKFNVITLFDVKIFADKKETYISTIYNISYPYTDRIWEDESLDRNDQGVSYGLNGMIIKDCDFENMGKTDSSSESEE